MTLKYFSRDEFACQQTGENEIQDVFLKRLDDLRDVCGFPFVITSGYRSPNHVLEASKSRPGTHSQGIASDIKADNGIDRRRIVENALRLGFNGIGIAKNFVHVDIRETDPVMWSYD
jgi:zinc D-Ala-D-Ala carboxypeptidase|tara:strand:+ start:707 stop:1057 length:351 start_codon:yes stop_codon:yes gene_type:complete